MLSISVRGRKDKKRYLRVRVVRESSMAEMAFNLGLDGGIDIRPNEVERLGEDILSEKNSIGPGIWVLGSNKKTTFWGSSGGSLFPHPLTPTLSQAVDWALLGSVGFGDCFQS